MKKLVLFLIFMLLASQVFAGQFVINYPDEQQGKIVTGLTDNEALCDDGEQIGVCAKRNLIRLAKEKVRAYEETQSAADAAQAVTDADLS
jgi:hypothetical protein